MGIPAQRLRRVFLAVRVESRFAEVVTFDIAGHGLRIPPWRLGRAAVIHVIGPEAFQRHMQAPGVVPTLELGAQKDEMVKSLDQPDVLESLVLEGLDDPLGDSNGPALSHRSETRLDVPLLQQRREGISGKDFGLV